MKTARRGAPGAWYRDLLRAYGPQGWWPGRSRFEIIVGAVLTQNVSWTNVERALSALRRAGMLDPRRMARAPLARIARLVRPAGFFRRKARTLRALLEDVEGGAGGDLDRYLRQPAARLRDRLLNIPGIGPETADSILLYAAGRKIFVVDSYTRRILTRHRVIGGDEPYDDLRGLLERSIPGGSREYNEAHALLVRVGKEHCRRRRALCHGCALEPHLPAGGPRLERGARLGRAVRGRTGVRQAGRRASREPEARAGRPD